MNHKLHIPGIYFLLMFLFISCGYFSKNEKVEIIGDEGYDKPNIIFVLADQWRAEATGYAGNDDVKTPNIDRLSKESVVFKNAVSAIPVCAPYRASLLTGQYPLTHGVFYNDVPLRNEAITMAELYKEVGYQTGYIGKWHLNGHEVGEDPFSARDQPVAKSRRQGFDYWKSREVSHDYNNSFYFDENDEKHTWEGYDAFAQTDSAISYINKNKNKPFLLFLSWGSPHAPYHTAPEKYQEMYDPKTLSLRPNVPERLHDKAKKMLAGYYAHCTALDDSMGDLLKALEKEGIADNTIFVFTSDHGDMLLSHGKKKKQQPFDESALVPMLIRYPVKFGRDSKEINKPINTPDILPTLLGLSNLSIPASVEGTDFSNALLGEEVYSKDAALISCPVPFHQWNFENGGREYRAVRTERYTYARDLEGPWLLYDNEQDPYQKHNLVNEAMHEELQRKLNKLLDHKLQVTNDKFLPADEYMKQWNYHYDFNDSIRPSNYYSRTD